VVPGDSSTAVTRTSDSNATKTWIAGSVTFPKAFEIGPYTSPDNVCFTLQYHDGVSFVDATFATPSAEICEASPGASTSFAWGNLRLGEYQIIESLTPNGYATITPIGFFVTETNPDVTLPEAENLLQPGDLRILKLEGPVPGTTWIGDPVTINISCADPNPPTGCTPGTLVRTVVFPTGQTDPLLETGFAEGDYEICEVVPLGFTADQECFPVTVLAGVAGAEAPLVTFVNTPPTEGCTPGYWKNHTELWD
ncbi:unnamed protein product, partial [marine sediment metagenome]